jgi:SRSO17 transposase
MGKPRPPKPTVRFVDEYCQVYQDLFPEVRSFEAFKYLHLKENFPTENRKIDILEKLFVARKEPFAIGFLPRIKILYPQIQLGMS